MRLVNIKKAQLYSMEETYCLGKLRHISTVKGDIVKEYLCVVFVFVTVLLEW